MDLSGAWSFELDPSDRGIDEGWHSRPLNLNIILPGSLQAQGFGDPISLETPWTGDIIDRTFFESPRYAKYRQPGQIKVPFWLQPETYYLGPAWFQREVEIPPTWAGRRVTLFLERPHWETRLWLDGAYVGNNLSLSVPHIYGLGTGLAPGKHRLALRVDNRRAVNVGSNAHSITDHTQTNWNGMVGRIELSAGSPLWVENVQVFPDVAQRRIHVQVNLRSALERPARGLLTLSAESGDHRPAPALLPVDLPAGGEQMIETDYALGEDSLLWDEFHPALYRLDATLEANGWVDTCSTRFGLREIKVQGTQLALNGRPIFIRGTLECCIFPLTGYPPTDLPAWKRIIRIAKAHGLNQLRFHSWCPPEAAFTAADEEGFFFQVEIASWANQGASIGNGDPLDEWLYEEARRIIAANGNHPSWIMMAYGNEPDGDLIGYLSKWVAHWKVHDPRRAHTSGAGWPAIPQNDFHNVPQPRIQGWGEETNSRINGLPPETMTDYREYVANAGAPVVSHEIGQWCVFPNFAEMSKYTGHLKAKNFEIFRDFLVEKHMGDQAHDFLIASGKLQALCYKEEIELALRTPGFGGFQLLDLHDFPGQGTALVGVLDPFWESKGYISAEEYSRFCNATVPLARLPKRILRAGEMLLASVELAHYGPAALTRAVAVWKLLGQDGSAAASGRLGPVNAPTGGLTHFGALEVDTTRLTVPAKYSLVIGIEGTPYENDWDVWVYPAQVNAADSANVLVTHELGAGALAHLASEGKVLLLLDPAQVQTPVKIGFSSIFWNTAWTRNQAPHTLGVLVDPAHALFKEFPTEMHSNWQWWELVKDSAALVIDNLPPALRPLVQPIDTWFESRRLSLLFEARVDKGTLAVCTMDLDSRLEERIVARQMRAGLLVYMGSPAFDPQVQVTIEQIRGILS